MKWKKQSRIMGNWKERVNGMRGSRKHDMACKDEQDWWWRTGWNVFIELVWFSEHFPCVIQSQCWNVNTIKSSKAQQELLKAEDPRESAGTWSHSCCGRLKQQLSNQKHLWMNTGVQLKTQQHRNMRQKQQECHFL